MRIPTYERQQDIQPAHLPMADPEALTKDLGAARRFGQEGTELGARLMVVDKVLAKRAEELQLENEQAIAEKAVYGFKTDGYASLQKAMETVGEDAVGTTEKPGLRVRYQEDREKARNTVLEGFQGSEKVRNALSKALDSVIVGEISQVSAHEAAQSRTLKQQTVDAIFADASARVATGASVEEATGTLNQAVDMYLGGSQAAKLLYKSKLEVIGQKKAKDQLVTNTLTDLKAKYPDVEKRLEAIEAPDFAKSLGAEGAEIQNTLISYTLREYNIQEAAYKKFATEKVGQLSQKIYNHEVVTPEDMAGLRQNDVATIEKVRDYQIRQDRADLREQRQLEREKEQDKRQAAYDRRESEREAKIARQEKSDSIAGNIIAKIIRNEPLDPRTDIYGEIPNGLDTNKANQLVQMAGKLADPGYKLGLDVLKQAIPDKAEYGRAVLDFQSQVETAKAQGEKIIAIAEAISKPKKKSKVTEWLDGVWGETKDRIKADSFFNVPAGTGPSQEDLEFTAKKHGITVDEVKRRMNAR